MSFEFAPDCCIVCGKRRPVTCSSACLVIALERHEKTGRVDDQKN
jgi:hypothetical protein